MKFNFIKYFIGYYNNFFYDFFVNLPIIDTYIVIEHKIIIYNNNIIIDKVLTYFNCT